MGWAVGLVFTLRSDAPRNPVIPALGIAAFVAVTFTSITAVSETMDNPARLNAKTYDRILDGMTAAEVEGLLGPAMASPDRKSLDLAGKGVALPGDIVARLPQGADRAEAISAKVSITIGGEPSKRNAKTGLGASAANGGNGVIGLQIILKEGGNQTTITEGKDWTYAPMDTAETVARNIGAAIDAHESWKVTAPTDAAPTRLMIESALPHNSGESGNAMTCRAAPEGKNTAIRVGYRDDGKPVNFRGGQPSVELKFWLEKDIVMDGDFTMTDRLVVVGYVDEKVQALKQAGLGSTIRDLLTQRKDIQSKYDKIIKAKGADSPDPASTVEAQSIKDQLDQIDKQLAKKGHKA